MHHEQSIGLEHAPGEMVNLADSVTHYPILHDHRAALPAGVPRMAIRSALQGKGGLPPYKGFRPESAK